MDIDSKEALAEFSQELSKRLGRDLVIDKVANRLFVLYRYERAELAAEVTEQELLASDRSPVDVFADLLERDLTIEVVVMPKESRHKFCTIKPIPGSVGEARAKELGEFNPRLFLNVDRYPIYLDMGEEVLHRELPKIRWSHGCPRGSVPFHTLSSEVCYHEQDALFDLKQLLTKIDALGENTKFALFGGVKTHQDDVTKKAQAWVDVAILKGKWKLGESEVVPA